MFMTITRDYGKLSCAMLRGCEYKMQDLLVFWPAEYLMFKI